MLAALNHPRSANTEAMLKLKSYCQQIVQPVLPQIQLATESTDWDVFRAALGSDKKNSSDQLRLILPNSNSELEIVEIPLLPEQLILATTAIQLALKEISNDCCSKIF
jgi:3-dehydroquinate synthetase